MDWFRVVETLIGVVVGATLALLGSFFLNKRLFKRQLEIKRIEDIYIPLYNELVKNHNDILVENPHPVHICFRKGDGNVEGCPKYSVWDNVKLDARYLETPKNVISLMDGLLLAIQEYDDMYKKSIGVIESYLRKILIIETGGSTFPTQIERTIISAISISNRNLIADILGFTYGHYKQFEDEKKEKIIDRMITETPKIESFINLEQKRKKWQVAEKQAIDHLAKLIQEIKKEK